MAFKLTNPPYKVDNTPVYSRDLGPGVLAESLNNQDIIMNDKLDPKFHNEVEEHEGVHIQQMKDGRLSYDDDFIYFDGKKIKKDSKVAMSGDPSKLGYEAEAYQKSGTKYLDNKYNV